MFKDYIWSECLFRLLEYRLLEQHTFHKNVPFASGQRYYHHRSVYIYFYNQCNLELWTSFENICHYIIINKILIFIFVISFSFSSISSIFSISSISLISLIFLIAFCAMEHLYHRSISFVEFVFQIYLNYPRPRFI